MTINELIPVVATLSHAEKFQLMQIVLQQLVAEESINNHQSITVATDSFDPRRYFGCAHQTRQSIDEYLAATHEG